MSHDGRNLGAQDDGEQGGTDVHGSLVDTRSNDGLTPEVQISQLAGATGAAPRDRTACHPCSPMRILCTGRTDAGARGSGVIAFVVSGAVATIALGLAGVLLIQRTGRSEAIRDAKGLSRFAGEGIVAPVLTDAVLQGQPAALAALDRVVRSHVLEGAIVRVKIWSPTGRIVYSDSAALIGETYPLGDEEQARLKAGGVAAEVSDLSKPENRLDRHWDKLLEVYLPIRTRTGSPVLFETYSLYRSVAASGQRVWREFAPAIIGGLLLLELLQVPLAVRLSRQLRQGQRDREALLQRAIQASDLERRRIARDLHDGPCRTSPESPTRSPRPRRRPPTRRRRAPSSRAHAATRRSVRQLRGLLVELYPPDLQRAGLVAALTDALAPFPARARHGVARCPGASRPPAGGNAWISVRDNERGSDPAAATRQRFGLRLLRDLVGDAGGRFELESAPGAGTFLRVEVPTP